MITGKKILLLAPHPDDPEYGCGASIARWGPDNEIFYAAFSPCRQSLPEGFSEGTLYDELKNSATVLQIPEANVFTYNFPVRNFPEHRQEILETLVSLRKTIAPDIVVLPNSTDIHQDHEVIHREGKRAFKHSCLLGYELPWNNITFTASFHVKLSQENLNTKWDAICAYKSQEQRAYNTFEIFEGLARVRGMQVGSEYAEAFELIRWVL